MTPTITPAPLQSFATCATKRIGGLVLSLGYCFATDQWQLLSRNGKVMLARFRPSAHPAPTHSVDSFAEACAYAAGWLTAEAACVLLADADRMSETAADYLR